MPDSPAQSAGGADAADAADSPDSADSNDSAAALQLSCFGSDGVAPSSAPALADARARPELDGLAREVGETDCAFANSIADWRDHAACTALRLDRVVFFEVQPIARFHSTWQRHAARVRRAGHGAPPACCGARSA